MNEQITRSRVKEELITKLSHLFGVTPEEASDEQYYKAIASLCNEKLASEWYEYRHRLHDHPEAKGVYYLCMEFLMGRSLKNNLYNMNLTGVVDEVCKELGVNLEQLYECEPDAGLGNGGLGRLAACYLDGLASGGYPSMGYGILYEYGIFKQKIVDGWQTELSDFWLPGGEVWLTEKPEEAVEVSFGGHLESNWDG
ncbi:MAG TPA: glycogen/starch/alpha-glucan phosphorylase, partial [Clostridiales bacterium]|nr:glycogen/starch/alpha-glucan phosphorylase [Clostridiales bacterium]